MSGHAFVETTKLTSKGQATIPKSVREIIGVAPGDKISFVVCNGSVQLVNANEFAIISIDQSKQDEPDNY